MKTRPITIKCGKTMKDENKITLNQAEIQEACKLFVTTHYKLTPKDDTDKPTVILRVVADQYMPGARSLEADVEIEK